MSVLRGMDSRFVFVNRWGNPVKERPNLAAELCSKSELSRTVDGFITTLPRWEQLYKGQAQAIENIPMGVSRACSHAEEIIQPLKVLDM